MFRPPLRYSALSSSGGPDLWKTCVGLSGAGTATSLPRSGSFPRVRLCHLQVWGVTALTPGPATSSAGMGWSGWYAYPHYKFRKPKPGCTGAEGASTQACGLLLWTLPRWASVPWARTHACLLGFVAQIFLLSPVTVGKAREWKGPGGHGGSERGSHRLEGPELWPPVCVTHSEGEQTILPTIGSTGPRGAVVAGGGAAE